MRVLVTGGAGFIGSHVVDLLVAEGHDVVSVDAITAAAHSREPAYLNTRAEHLRITMDDLPALAATLDGIDAVCPQ